MPAVCHTTAVHLEAALLFILVSPGLRWLIPSKGPKGVFVDAAKLKVSARMLA